MAVPPDSAPTYPSYSPRPEIRFDAISEAWKVFQPNMGAWIVAELIFIICMGIAYAIAIALMFATAAIFTAIASKVPIGILAFPIMMFIPATIILIAMNTMLGGMYRMAIGSLRGEAIGPNYLFSVTDVLPQLVIGAVLSGIIIEIGMMFCYIPGFIAAGLLMFTVPLIVDRRMNGIDAMKLSFETLKPQLAMATLFIVVAAIVGYIGIVACFIGIFFTLPLFFISVAINYRNFFMEPGPGPYAPPPPSMATDVSAAAPTTTETVVPAPPAPAATDVPPVPPTPAVPETPPPPPPDTPELDA